MKKWVAFEQMAKEAEARGDIDRAIELRVKVQQSIARAKAKGLPDVPDTWPPGAHVSPVTEATAETAEVIEDGDDNGD